MNDDKIIDLFFKRSEQAIVEAKRKYENYCHSIAFNILRNPEDCEECVNDVFLQIWNTIPPQKPNRFAAFIGKIARNIALNKQKYYTTQKRGAGNVDVVLDELTDCLPAKDNIDQIIEDIYIVECLNKFLKEQNIKTRRIFVRRYWYMDSIAIIANNFSMSESSVKMLLSRTRNSLRSFLEKEGVSI